MKHILMIATGGTIASKETADGLTPQLTSEELLAEVPELEQLCRIDTVQLMNRDSTNINSRDWLQMAACVREHYDAYDGFVLTHGTDTMAYTAAALSYLIQNNAKPVVITGSQKSIFNQDTDARENLRDVPMPGSHDYKPYKGLPLYPSSGIHCSGCGTCSAECPAGAIDQGDPRKPDKTKCISCMRCITVCPFGARSVPKAAQLAVSAALLKMCAGRKSPSFYL